MHEWLIPILSGSVDYCQFAFIQRAPAMINNSKPYPVAAISKQFAGWDHLMYDTAITNVPCLLSFFDEGVQVWSDKLVPPS